MKHFHLPLILTLLIGALSCENRIPGDILDEKHMTEVLYDYHLACALASQSKDSVSFREKQYVEAVFKKHGITSADFDSSLVWYSRHTGRLFNIYKDINERYAGVSKILGTNSDIPHYSSSPSGDTTNIWTGNPSYLLRAIPGYNRFAFTYPADSSFMAGDRFMLHVNGTFKYPEGRKEAFVALMTRYENDSVVLRSTSLFGSGRISINFPTDEKLRVKEVSGFVYTDAAYNTTKERVLQLSDITLLRIRMKKEEPKTTTPVDSVIQPNDSLVVDSSKVTPERRLFRPTPVRKIRRAN